MTYFKKIDGLRFIAIFFVLIQHFARFIGERISAGYYGVDLFFVISGFLITGILVRPNDNSFKKNYLNFIGRRTIRIFPIYYLAIAILWIAQLEAVRQYLNYLITYTFNYAIVNFNLSYSPVMHFWSLNVEEQFYLFWPLLVLSLKNQSNLLLFITASIVLAGYSQICFNIFPSLTPYNYWGLFTRMASLGLGALGAIISDKKLLPDKVFRNQYFEYFMLIVLVLSLIVTFQFKPLLFGLCSIYLVLKAAFYDFSLGIINKFLVNKSVIYIGTISYGIYVYHLPMEYYLSRYLLDPLWASINFSRLGVFEKLRYNVWIVKFPLYSILSIVLAALSFRYFEKPLLSLKNKYFKYQ